MGAYNNPVVLPYQPTFAERITPTVLGVLGNAYLQKMGQDWKANQVKLANVRQDKMKAAEMLSSGGWEPVSPWAQDSGNAIELAGKRFRPAPLTLRPMMYKDEKGKQVQLPERYVLEGLGMDRKTIHVPKGITLHKSLGRETDPYGQEKDTVYGEKSDGTIVKFFDPTQENQERIKGQEARKTEISKQIAAGKLVAIPEVEAHTLHPAQLGQLVQYEGKYYAPSAGPQTLKKKPTFLEIDKGLRDWVALKQKIEAGDETQLQTVYKILALQKGVSPEALETPQSKKQKVLDFIDSRIRQYSKKVEEDPLGILD